MSLRRTAISRMKNGHVDVLVVGAGINGAVTAAALAGRGASVALIDRADFGGFTSQESSNLVWGGFKYLENYELPLVFGLCKSRNRLMKAYPDNVKEISFLATLDNTAPFKPWFAALGATAYWGIGQFGTKPPRLYNAEKLEAVEPVIDTTSARGAVQYQDCYLVDNDSRFVFSFVRSAIEAGAAVANYVELVSARREGDRWVCQLRDTDSGEEFTTTARVVVNAAGPFVDELNTAWGVTTDHRIVYSKGIHLIVPRLTTTRHNRVLAFFDDTQRLFYVIPMGRRSVIGTTDTRVDDPHTHVTDEDRDFLLAQINARLDLPAPLTHDDIIAERSGVRPLVVRRGGSDQTNVDWTSLSRKHEIERDDARGVVTIFGGKLTDCLNVGEEVAEHVERLGIPLEKDLRNWYGEPAAATRKEFYRQARLMRLDSLRTKPDTEPLTDRLWRRYGRRAFDLLEMIRADPTMGEDVMGSADYLRAELHTAAEHEMVVTLDDFMRRRSKIDLVVRDRDILGSPGLTEVAGILFGDDADARLADYVLSKTSHHEPPADAAG
ncbi:MAG TPA: glycerol-3-phosphate dehydrogenase/oxidase [Ornithinibacter sp.]|jgi:glycerol-3-phosphate dehydrogenase|nr:glycerol-3-phosphate dehydrogenase/oxidase [Dermatophilaceae bacterium]HQA13209.1 glycerol-3-phosphate dehydrogenase/oxidase [Ornithinibacter sp.]HQD67647.1 glycerol-3-phosphate dehydrogenase/oxidase [Ornithinibacter sp.]HQV83319.1 glycerol-3-phosphate dehydrogenase/oxidase [Ornithinibacter sp.]HQW74582.1 glycerol-3-phosphate dehydrogenase/oxidase [Ornithinibacter sp.]